MSQRVPVSPRVGNVKNNDPSLIEPIAGIGAPAPRRERGRAPVTSRR